LLAIVEEALNVASVFGSIEGGRPLLASAYDAGALLRTTLSAPNAAAGSPVPPWLTRRIPRTPNSGGASTLQARV